MSRSLHRAVSALGLLALLGGLLPPALGAVTTTPAPPAPAPLLPLPGTPATLPGSPTALPEAALPETVLPETVLPETVLSRASSSARDRASSSARERARRAKAEAHRRIWADPASDRVLVNRDNPLRPLAYVPPKLEEISGGQRLRPSAAAAYRQMESAAAASGVHLVAVSGYRSAAEQQAIRAQLEATLGPDQASRLSAAPGTSEHQTGLAVDVASPSGECTLLACFEGTPEGRWVRENAWRHGFIIRYPQGETKTTGYDYEPWHLRFVGRETAAEMRTRGITVYEEYAELASR